MPQATDAMCLPCVLILAQLTFCTSAVVTFATACGNYSTSPTATCSTCYTPTTYITEIVPCPAVLSCPPHPDCVLLTSTVISSMVCNTTALLTTNQCTSCQTGCLTSTTTITAAARCVYPSPSSCSYATVTTTSGVVNCPLEPVCSASGCASTVTITQPAQDPWCPFTPTTVVGPTCPSGKDLCCPTKTSTVTAVS